MLQGVQKRILDSCKEMDLRMFPPGGRDLIVEDIPRAQDEAVEEFRRSGIVKQRGGVVWGEIVQA